MHTNKLDNLDEMGKFLENHKPPKLTQEDTEKQNRSVTSRVRITNFKTSTKKQSSKKAQAHVTSLVIPTKHLKSN